MHVFYYSNKAYGYFKNVSILIINSYTCIQKHNSKIRGKIDDKEIKMLFPKYKIGKHICLKCLINIQAIGFYCLRFFFNFAWSKLKSFI